MNFDAVHIFSNFGTIFGVVGTLATVVLGFKNARDKLTLASYKESNAAYEELIKARDLQHEQDVKQHESNLDRIKSLEQTVKILDERVTQAPQITDLALQLGKQHKELMRANNTMAKELGNIAKAIAKDH